MTCLEYIRQLPNYADKDEDDLPCVAAFNFDNHGVIDECGGCYRGEATINGQPAPYLFACPVKPGQTVYIPYKIVIDGEKCGINAEKVGTITFYEDSWYAHFERDLGGFNEAYWMADVFPTREAAEKRLEELKS